ncbi:MAG: TraB/GumN family protein [Peptoniphilus sp.]|uniref:TraB/GumN family protein n=1 Tax=Peptoniphilus sp. TaxID=1971214 RepID=UPI002A75C744|nr:TraB/GumN family protein [Peptoniphilus sp.]MDY2986532.1 TraB/GumN family protein [Peptoniphilus sp.]
MKIIKKLTATLGLTLILSTNTFAAQVQQPTISPWAVKIVNNAQMQGIVPISIEQQEKNFTVKLNKQDLDALNTATQQKLEQYKLKKNPKFKSENLKNDFTKEDVIINIYNIVGEYSDDLEKNAVEYFKEKKLLEGDGFELGLNQPATLEQAIALYTRAITDIVNDQNMGAKGVFYKTEANGNTVYMLGSIHVGDSTMYPIDSDIIDAYNSSDELFVEADITNAEKVLAAQSSLISKIPLNQKLSPELYSRFKAIMDKYKIPEENYKNLKVSAAYTNLSSIPMVTEMPLASAKGIDQYFLINSKLDNKKIGEIESIAFQLDMLDKFGDQKYVKLIEELIPQIEKDNAKKLVEQTKSMQKFWTEGNEREFSKIFNTSDEFTKHLVVDRDPKMADKIDEMLKSKDKKTYFVVVGSGHYTSEKSVINYLQEKGYKVENLTGK